MSPAVYAYPSPLYTPASTPQPYVPLQFTEVVPLTPQNHTMAHPDQSMPPPSMQPSSSSPIPIDPALAMYSTYYTSYGQNHFPPQSQLPAHVSLPPNYSSPSSQGSDTIGTPPTEHMYTSSSGNMKRPASTVSAFPSESRKKARKNEESDSQSPIADKEEQPKAKPTRGSRYLTGFSM